MPRKKMQGASGFASTTSQCIDTDFGGVVHPFLLTSEQQTATNAITITNVLALISYLDACAVFPIIATWIYAINKGWYSTWPGLTSGQIQKHLAPFEHMSM